MSACLASAGIADCCNGLGDLAIVNAPAYSRTAASLHHMGSDGITVLFSCLNGMTVNMASFLHAEGRANDDAPPCWWWLASDFAGSGYSSGDASG